MNATEFDDYYELLEVSPNASEATIEQVFRYLAKLHHPDTSPASDQARFGQLIEAFETLRSPEKRAAYDAVHDRQKETKTETTGGANTAGADTTGDDSAERHQLLTVFYSQRRRNFKKPGIGPGSLGEQVDFSAEVLEFHLWYFLKRGWIDREDGGQLSITAIGVDQFDSMSQQRSANPS